MTSYLPLLSQVKEWLETALEFTGFVKEWADKLKQFLEKYCPTCWSKVVEAANKTLEMALGILIHSKDNILKVCRENKDILKSMVLKLGTKSAVKLVAQETVQVAAKEGARYGVKQAAKVGVRSGTKLASRTATKVAVRGVSKVALKSISNPIGAVADIAQAGLELSGNEDAKKAGKVVGFGGNAGGGAVAGFAVAGPVGAGVGAVVGTGIWLVGELVGSLFD